MPAFLTLGSNCFLLDIGLWPQDGIRPHPQRKPVLLNHGLSQAMEAQQGQSAVKHPSPTPSPSPCHAPKEKANKQLTSVFPTNVSLETEQFPGEITWLSAFPHKNLSVPLVQASGNSAAKTFSHIFSSLSFS